MPAGRPSSFRPEYVEQARKLCDLGATDMQLADFFEVSVVTLNAWKSQFPEFLKALKVGKEAPDQNVKRSLYQRALGYQRDAVKIFMPAGAEEPIYAPYREDVAPDTTACIFWLKNRRPDEWRDRQDHTLSSPDGGPVQTETTLNITFVHPTPEKDEG